MTDINIRLKILNDYKEKFASYRMDVGWVSYYVKEYSIDPCDSQTHSDAIKKLKEEREKIEIPEPIDTKPIPVRSKSIRSNIVTKYSSEEEKIEFIKVKVYKDLTIEEVNKRKKRKKDINYDISNLNEMLSITNFNLLALDKPKNENHSDKIKRDTKSKVNSFIKSYLENSSKYKMETNVRISELTNVSTGTLSRYFNKSSEILDELIDELGDRLKVLNDKRNEIIDIDETIDNVLINLKILEAKKEKLLRKANTKNYLSSKRKKKITT